VDDATIDATIGQLRRHRLLDDAAFAEYWVEQRQTFRPRGARAVHAELARLGVSRPVADDATVPLADSAEEDAYRAATRKANQLRSLDERTFQTRLGQWLARRGFDWEVTAKAVARLWAETR
jgi:regulatory protein